MSAALHLNLLKDEERVSPLPVRLRLLGPLLGVTVLLGCLLGWALLGYRAHMLAENLQSLEQSALSLKPSHTTILDIRAKLKETHAALGQLGLYERSCLRFGDALTRLPAAVPPEIQFTEIRLALPQPPLTDPKKPALGPTNTLERVSLRIAGRTTGEGATRSVDAFLAALRAPAYTNLFQSVQVPKGGFRQDPAAQQRQVLLFEVACDCLPRRFQE